VAEPRKLSSKDPRSTRVKKPLLHLPSEFHPFAYSEMSPKTFLEKFDLIADAPGAVAKMRELVLDWAVTGRLCHKIRMIGRRGIWVM
jgi:hypothetical protein